MSESHQEWSASAHPVVVRDLRHSVSTFAAGVGFSGSALDDVRTCVSEAVTNAVLHGYRDGRAPGTITVRADLHADELVIVVSDDGIGFTPRPDSPGLGLGIPTITALTDSMSIAAPVGRGTQLCMAFAR